MSAQVIKVLDKNGIGIPGAIVIATQSILTLILILTEILVLTPK
jgi:hypothetical protein